MGFEANTCRIRITPKLKAHGWDSAPLSLSKQRSLTGVRIIVALLDLRPLSKRNCAWIQHFFHYLSTSKNPAPRCQTRYCPSCSLVSCACPIEADPLLNTIPSVQKRVASGGFYFHACKDTPDVRAVLLRYLRELPCEAEMVVARKIPALFEKQHNGREDEFYADLLAHLLKNRLQAPRNVGI